ncbi:APC family permease [Erythrobacter sp.]|uniref:APC family permease n=1 Tax=Erythrobacter sp. TaxID=1042 RepID=UPI001425BC75|nr:amino acid permease [Erythrobacter sp.]QIQ85806.1 MAG: amino acid permease [Erythrobacter sp.]
MPLKRSMGLASLILYGTGTILGAGIFVVIGEVMGEAGTLAPLAYAAAGVVAVFTALSFAEIAARVPSAGGAIDYVRKGFGSDRFAGVIGWMMIIANIVSGATITTGFVSYLNSFTDVPHWIATSGLVVLLGAISIAGMKQSAWFMSVTTAIGIATLVVVLWLLRDSLIGWPGRLAESGEMGSAGAASAILAGAFLAIYSFIGFGDVAQTAEEVKDVKKTLPLAMWLVLVIVFVFYLAIAAALAGRGDIDAIAGADAPLVYAATADTGFPALPLAIASLFVIVNGALTQVIAAARLLMDMGRDDLLATPAVFGRVNSATHTPIVATLASLGVILVLALFVPLGTLASGTSLAILVVFTAVNAALWRMKREGQPEDVPNMWKLVPVLGVVTCALAVVGQVVLWMTGIGG